MKRSEFINVQSKKNKIQENEEIESKILGYRDPRYKHENPSEQAKIR